MTDARTWSPAPSTVVAELAVVVVAAALAAFTGVPIGRFLLGVLAAGALAFAVQDLAARPALAADADGITVRAPWRPVQLRWAEVDRIAVVTTRRLLVLHSLEIDADHTLVLLTRRRLGVPLGEVVDALDAIRPTLEADAAR